VKKAILLMYHTLMHVWKQPVLSNEGSVSCTRKQQEPLTGFTPDRHSADNEPDRLTSAQAVPMQIVELNRLAIPASLTNCSLNISFADFIMVIWFVLVHLCTYCVHSYDRYILWHNPVNNALL